MTDWRKPQGSKITKRWIIGILLAVVVLCCLYRPLTELYDRVFYPIQYSEQVEFYADQYDLDPYLVYAVIKTESGFDPDSISSVEAKGLMQVTSDTFDWISMKLGYTDYVHDDLYDPTLCIEYGCYLLGYLFDQFNEVEVVLTAYHAGMNITAEWLENADYSTDGVMLDEIPYSDTDHYVSKVMNNYEGYLNAYTQND